MGCDIHPHIEYKHFSESAYGWFAAPNLSQDYLLFALLAGVRREWVKEHFDIEITPVVAPRGLPEDASYGTKRGHGGYEIWSEVIEQWYLDEFHSASWLNTEELAAVAEIYFQTLGESFEEYKEQHGIEWGVELRAVLRAMEALPNARLVFWFDN